MQWRNIRTNHSNALPRYLVSLDTETIPEPRARGNGELHRLRLGVARFAQWRRGKLSDARVLVFTDRESFWRELRDTCGPRHTTWVVAHNAAFDLRALRFQEPIADCRIIFDSPRSKREKSVADKAEHPFGRGFCVLECPPVILGLRWLETGGRFLVLDTLNWFRAPLYCLGERCGLPKLPMPAFAAPDADWIEYCQRDAEIIERTMAELIEWVHCNNMGRFAYTAAGQAFNAYRHGRMPKVSFPPRPADTRPLNADGLVEIGAICFHSEPEVRALERAAFFGGQTECYFIGRHAGRCYHLDVTSLYPSMMAAHRFPRYLRKWEVRHDWLPLAPAIEPHESIAEVELCTFGDTFPRRDERGTYYPVGSFRTCLAGPELQRAVLSGAVRKWRSWATYFTSDLFADYVRELWGLRAEAKAAGDQLYEYFAKLLLNSLYGRLARKGDGWVDEPTMYAPEPWSTWHHIRSDRQSHEHYRAVGWRVQRRVERMEHPIAAPSIAAFVTSYARERMRSIRQAAGQANVLYQATDSVFVTQAGYDRLLTAETIHQFALGKLRLVAVADDVTIRGIGDYQFGDRNVVSGLRRSAVATGPDAWRQEVFCGPATLFHGMRECEPFVTQETWTRRGSYAKGAVQRDGTVSPFALSEGSEPSAPVAAEADTAKAAAAIADSTNCRNVE